MKSIGVLRTYEIYNAMKLHWTNKAYDFVKYKGILQSTNRVRLDGNPALRNLFVNLNNKYKTDIDLISFLIPSFLHNPNFSYPDFFDEGYVKRADDWFWRIKKMKSSFRIDCNFVMEFLNKNKVQFDYFFKSDLVYNALIQESISIESFIIFDRVLNFLDKSGTDDIIYHNIYEMKVKKYSSFIFVDPEEYKRILGTVIILHKEALCEANR